MLIPLGILAASGGGGAYEHIESVDLVADGVVTFSSIPATYKHLQLRVVARSSSSTHQPFQLRMNGVTTNAYSFHNFGRSLTATVTGSSSLSSAINLGAQLLPEDDTDTGNAGIIVNIMDYTNTSKNTTVSSYGGTIGPRYIASGMFINTSLVNSISISSSMLIYSHLSLYGIKG